jgi:hypothetical protein
MPWHAADQLVLIRIVLRRCLYRMNCIQSVTDLSRKIPGGQHTSDPALSRPASGRSRDIPWRRRSAAPGWCCWRRVPVLACRSRRGIPPPTATTGGRSAFRICNTQHTDVLSVVYATHNYLKNAFMFQVTNIPVKNYTLGVYFMKLIKKHILGGLLFLYTG